jgi:glutathione S-transferase
VFSVADLAAAALLAPVCSPPHPDMSRPQPVPEAVKRWEARWADHPGVAWELSTYREHRPVRSASAA